jgi:hypothetical protein
MKKIAAVLLFLLLAGTVHADHKARRQWKRPKPRSILYPNGITGPVFDAQYPYVGCIPNARAYIYDKSYDRDAHYCRGWKNGPFGISLDGKHK